MKPSKLFILVLILLSFLAGLAWLGVRHLSGILQELDHVVEVDLVLMEAATKINEAQLAKEIAFTKLTATAEELAFGQVNASRQQYLLDYVQGMKEQYGDSIELTTNQLQRIEKISGVTGELKDIFKQIQREAEAYDQTVQGVFKSVEAGGFQLSLDELELTGNQQQILKEHVQTILADSRKLVNESVEKSKRWRQQSKIIFWFSLLLSMTLGLAFFVFKRHLDEIARQKKDLEKLNQELDRFVHTVSHDIAGPLTTIVGYAAYLESHYAQQVDERGRDCIKGVRKGASRLNVLIKDMLELTKMSRVKNPYVRVAVKEIVDAAMANCDFLIRQSNAQIHIDRPLPEIMCDRIKLTAVFFNLIHNALKFTKPEKPPVIHINWDETPREYTFYVQDNGIGIKSLHHQEVFSIFKRLHAPDQYGGGSGVGLAIVKAAVEDQGGVIHVESRQDQGTKFIFTVPKLLNPR